MFTVIGDFIINWKIKKDLSRMAIMLLTLMMSRKEKKRKDLALNLFLLCPCCVYTADMTDVRNTI